LSADAKLDKGLESAMAKDFIEEKIPFIDLIDEFTGLNTKKYLTKNPRAMFSLMKQPGVQNLLGKFMGNNGAQGSNQSRGRM